MGYLWVNYVFDCLGGVSMDYLVVGLFDDGDGLGRFSVASGNIASPFVPPQGGLMTSNILCGSISPVFTGAFACGSVGFFPPIMSQKDNVVRGVSGVRVVVLGKLVNVGVFGVVSCRDGVVSEAIFDPDEGDLFFRCECRFSFDRFSSGEVVVPFLFGGGVFLVDSCRNVSGLGDCVLKSVVFGGETLGLVGVAVEARKYQVLCGGECVSVPKYFLCS